jgi:hypothetical protein
MRTGRVRSRGATSHSSGMLTDAPLSAQTGRVALEGASAAAARPPGVTSVTGIEVSD